MANTYSQLHIQVVFTVRDRVCLILPSWKDDLYRYITGIIQNNNHKVLAINGMPDHIHILFGMRPDQSLSALMQDIKGDSSKWINGKGFVNGKFSWQEGYGAFSYSRSHVERVIKYIREQEVHHQKRSFIDEYLDLLKKFGVSFDDRFLFKPVD